MNKRLLNPIKNNENTEILNNISNDNDSNDNASNDNASNDSTNLIICNNQNIYQIFFIMSSAVCYFIMLLMMYNDIHNMSNNLDKIIDFINVNMNININTTMIDYIHKDISLISNCVINKYCKRVPSE
tara:strand:+ start:81 stop:464 length:384 start_codon:yes stop_codon:yes gene_type:complete